MNCICNGWPLSRSSIPRTALPHPHFPPYLNLSIYVCPANFELTWLVVLRRGDNQSCAKHVYPQTSSSAIWRSYPRWSERIDCRSPMRVRPLHSTASHLSPPQPIIIWGFYYHCSPFSVVHSVLNWFKDDVQYKVNAHRLVAQAIEFGLVRLFYTLDTFLTPSVPSDRQTPRRISFSTVHSV